MANKTRLTDIAIQKIRPPATGQIEVWDNSLSGFGLRISAHGARSFILVYRHQGRPRRWTIGRYPALSLAQARRMASDATTAIETGIDPLRPQADAALKFADVLEEFFNTHCDQHNKPSTAAATRAYMRGKFLPVWGKRTLASLTRADVLAFTDATIKAGYPAAARQCFTHIRKFFAWCVERGRLPVSPITGVSAPTKQRSRSRVLSPEELAAVYAAATTLGYPFGDIVRLLILTAQRRNEVAAMEWQEVDGEDALWTIPAQRTKNSREHALPLGPAALSVVKAVPGLSDRLVFPARGNEVEPFSGWSKSKARLDRLSGVKDWTLHDLRRTAATRMAGLGVAPHVVERILNHSGGTFAGVAGIYNRFEYRDEMRAALIKWEGIVADGTSTPQATKSLAALG